MSYRNFKKAMVLATKCDYYTTAGGKSNEEIQEAERMLGLTFSNQCMEFYKKYGYLSFFGNEIFGIDPYDKSGILEGNSVMFAINDRKKFDLPDNWLPIYNFGDGNMAYLDYSCLNDENEPKVIMAFYNGNHYEALGTISEDLGDFILELVENQIEQQKRIKY